MVVRVVAIVAVVLGLVGAADASKGFPSIAGPRLVALGHDAEIDLPAGMILFERADAQRFLRTVGEPSEGVVAIVRKPGADWSVILTYAEAGYVDDADASQLDAGDLLAAYRTSTRADNERRRVLGGQEVAIDGWAEPPRYDRAQHRLVWGVAAHRGDGMLVNQFTRILGRNGFVSVNLIDAAATVDHSRRSRQDTRAIVEATRFQPGSRYEDHTPGDRRSSAGLAGLVLGKRGAMAGRLGVLARIARVWKPGLALLFLLGISGVFWRRFDPPM